MRVVIAPDSFKEALSASEAAEAIAKGVLAADPDAQIIKAPLGDGGEGTLDAILASTGARLMQARVHDALGRPMLAQWGLMQAGQGSTAIIELAQACGLEGLPAGQRDPGLTSTRGVGELIRCALDQGVQRILLTLGGSATNDGGSGMLSALGTRFLDSRGRLLAPGGAALSRLARIDLSDLDPRLEAVHFAAAVDVDNPLCGPRGASRVFAPQKGAKAQQAGQLDQALAHYADQVAGQLGSDYRDLPGAGAAGGMGFAAKAFLRAELRPGIELVLEQLEFPSLLRGADLLIVGEGSLDRQSLAGKTPIGAARVARQLGVPCVALVGRLGPGWQAAHEQGITAAFAIAQGPVDLAQALSLTGQHLTAQAEEILRLFLAARTAPGLRG